MSGRVDLATINWLLRIIALALAVIFNLVLIYDALLDAPVNRTKVIGLAVGSAISVAVAAWLFLNPPE